MNATAELCQRAARLGLRLEPRGSKLAVIPAQRCPQEFAAELKAHKRELLDFLETRTVHLTADCLPWLHVARQILTGEFDGADRSTVESLFIGLRATPHPLCQSALDRLRKESAT